MSNKENLLFFSMKCCQLRFYSSHITSMNSFQFAMDIIQQFAIAILILQTLFREIKSIKIADWNTANFKFIQKKIVTSKST